MLNMARLQRLSPSRLCEHLDRSWMRLHSWLSFCIFTLDRLVGMKTAGFRSVLIHFGICFMLRDVLTHLTAQWTRMGCREKPMVGVPSAISDVSGPHCLSGHLTDMQPFLKSCRCRGLTTCCMGTALAGWLAHSFTGSSK